MANVINMGGSGANIESKTVKSSQTQQTITPPDGVDGFNPVIVSPFTLQSKTVSPSTSQQVVKPDTGKDGLSQVTVNAMKLQSKTVDAKIAYSPVQAPSYAIETVKPDSGYDGFSQVTINGVALQAKTVGASGVSHTLYPETPYKGFSSVTVDPKLILLYTLSSRQLDPNTLVSAVIDRLSDFESYLDLTFGSYINLETDVLLINSLLQESSGEQFFVTGAWIPSWHADGVTGNGYAWARTPTNNPIRKVINSAANTITLKLPMGMSSVGQSIIEVSVTVLTLSNGNLG